MSSRIEYSERYSDGDWEYRHVTLPKEMARNVPKTRLMSESEWRALGIQQSRGWQHYLVHRPEPHVLIFRRQLGVDGTTGLVNPELRLAEQEKFINDNQGKVADPADLARLQQQVQQQQQAVRQQHKHQNA